MAYIARTTAMSAIPNSVFVDSDFIVSLAIRQSASNRGLTPAMPGGLTRY